MYDKADVFFEDYPDGPWVPPEPKPEPKPPLLLPIVIYEECVRFLKLMDIDTWEHRERMRDALREELFPEIDGNFNGVLGMLMARELLNAWRETHVPDAASNRQDEIDFCIIEAARYLSMRHEDVGQGSWPGKPIIRVSTQRWQRLRDTRVIEKIRERIDELRTFIEYEVITT